MMYFFDLDGTLLDSNGIWAQIDLEFLLSRGVSPVPEDYTQYVTHHSFPDAAAYTKARFHLEETPQQIMAEWEEMARRAYAQTLPLKPGVREFLDQCRQQGRRMAIITSCIPRLCRLALAHHGLDGWFEQIFTTCELGLEKSDEAIYRLAAQRCGVAVEACTLFDDSPANCRAAARAGMRVVGIADSLFAWGARELEQVCRRYLPDFSQAGQLLEQED